MAFFVAIYPSLVLIYAGQTAYLIKHPFDHGDVFYNFIPRAVFWPMYSISTLAAVVASQSFISAVFSVIKQSLVLDYFPRVRIIHSSQNKEAEIYCPEVNCCLMIVCIAVIVSFGDAKTIEDAFGM